MLGQCLLLDTMIFHVYFFFANLLCNDKEKFELINNSICLQDSKC